MADRKRPTFLYKIAVFQQETGDASFTLEKALRQAVAQFPKALARAQNHDADGVDFRFLNYHGSHITGESTQGIFGCEFLAYERGADQSTLAIDPNATEVDVDAIPAGGNKEFVAGFVYFGVADNHVAVIQSQGLRTQDLQEYLNWFLVQKTGVLSENNRVTLDDYSPRRRQPVRDVRGIEFDGRIQLQATAGDGQAIVVTDSEEGMEKGKEIITAKGSALLRPVGALWETVKTLFATAPGLERLNITDATHLPDLHLKVYLSWRGKRPEDDDEFMDSVARNLSHVDDAVDYTVHTGSGKFTRSDFKIFKKHSVGWTSKGRPRFDDLFPQMARWLADLQDSGKIKG